MKLNRTCNSEKRAFLVNKFPTVCKNIEAVMRQADLSTSDRPICSDHKWDPVRQFGFDQNDTTILG